ncbi:hypothetical protein BGX38DRAFT_1265678 [Terfezia claveryi]|nr:hypothetical protein BGX38DRAFT_1265678 [Terfezia claveryi]
MEAGTFTNASSLCVVFYTDGLLCGGIDVGCTTGKFFVGVTMEGASSMVCDTLLTAILLLGAFLLGAALLCTHSSRRQYPYAQRMQTNMAPDESPTPLEPNVPSPAIEPLPAVATDITSPKDSAASPLEAPPTVNGQPQTIINGAVGSLNLTINNNALPQSDQAALISMVEVLQALRADIKTIGRQVSRELRSRHKTVQGPPFHSCQQNPGPGPWAPANFDHYEYSSDSANDSGWGTDKHWRHDLGWYDQPVQEQGNDEQAGEDEVFETQTAIQERADCNVEAIDLWRSGTEEGAAADRQHQEDQCNVTHASKSSRSSRILPQQPPGPLVTPPKPIHRSPTPRSVQDTHSTTLIFTPSPTQSNVINGAIGEGLSTLDDGTLSLELNSQTSANNSLQTECEEVEQQSAEQSGSSHDQSQEGTISSNSRRVGQGTKMPDCQRVAQEVNSNQGSKGVWE